MGEVLYKFYFDMADTDKEQEIVASVMQKVEDFYFSDEENGGEKMFNEFAAKHHEIFEADCDAEDMENKLEYTQVYKEFCVLFETTIENLIKESGFSTE